jgi:dienelactone hydrolase
MQNVPNVLGDIGAWAASCIGGKGSSVTDGSAPALSFRHESLVGNESNLLAWREEARSKFTEALLMPELGVLREAAVQSVQIARTYELDCVRIEELSWQLPYGPRTQALFLRPASATADDSLPVILALHCHGGQKVFGLEKITRTDGDQHGAMAEHQAMYYGGRAWANEMAKRGYAVLVHDAFPFGSRRVLQPEVPDTIRQSCAPTEFQEEARLAAEQRATALSAVDGDTANAELAAAQAAMDEYNRWASEHEHVIAKSLFSAGLSWPGLLVAEDIAALDVLLARPGVDPTRVGCGGLSGGGLRTMLIGAVDTRVGCTVQVGQSVLQLHSYTGTGTPTPTHTHTTHAIPYYCTLTHLRFVLFDLL